MAWRWVSEIMVRVFWVEVGSLISNGIESNENRSYFKQEGFWGMFMLEWLGFVPTSGDFKIATRKPKLAFVF